MAAGMRSLRIIVTLLLLVLSNDFAGAVAFGDDRAVSLVATLFADDEPVLSDNVRQLIERTVDLSAEERFEHLAKWILPSSTRSGFRMNGEFLQTDALPGSQRKLQQATCEGILSPCFALIRTAEESGRLDDLRKRIEAIPDPTVPSQLRAKLAMLLMVRSAQRDQETAAALCARLSQEVRVRTENLNGQWWPETLALAWGMQHIQNRTELLELATSIYDPQIGQNRWSGTTAWDIFVAGCYASLRVEKVGESPVSADEPDVFKLWKPASVITANSRGNGYPREVWQRHGNAIHKVVGHENDYLYFPVPLNGNFEVSCDVSGFYYRETQVAWAGLYASHYWKVEEAEIGGIRGQTLVPLQPPLTYPDDWLTCRITVKDGVVRHFISGRLMLERTVPQGHFPWLALRTYRLSRGSVQNLTVTGEPQIPASVAMLADPDLEGWFSYFQDRVADAADQHSWRSEVADDGTRELLHATTPELPDAAAESLLLYHRPMMEDGVIDYEFYYEPGRTIVHPALDRMSFLLEPDGVKTHWITDGRFQRDDLAPANVSGTNTPADKIPLPLRASEWNRMQVSLKNDVVQLHLNGEPIIQAALAAGNRRQFGLFHFADQSSVRVRNMQWTGEWSRSVDPAVFPPTVRANVAAIEDAVEKLPQSFHHEFRNSSLPHGVFVKKTGAIVPTVEGVHAECVSENGWRQTDLSVSLEIGGDFDLQATFRDLKCSDQGNVGAQMMATLASTGQEVRIARNRFTKGDEMMKCQIGSIKVNGQWQYTDTWSKLASTEGIFRLVRLSDKLHYLFAESASSGFRLIHTETIGTEDLRLGDTSLSVFVADKGTVSCLWTDLRIHAERLSGTALLNSAELVSTLNDERAKLPVHLLFDFEKAEPDPNEFYQNSDNPEWKAADKGFVLESVGQEGWVASMVGSRLPIDGDFDVTLTLDEADLAMPSDGRHSTLMWQIQQQGNDRTRFASMFRRTPTEYKAVAQQHKTLPDGSHAYTWHGDLEVKKILSLRIARRGNVYTMLARPEGSERDEVIHQTKHFEGPILLHCLLHTGATGKKSRVLLKSIEVHAEVYDRR